MGGVAPFATVLLALSWVTGSETTASDFVGRSSDPLIESFERDGYVVRASPSATIAMAAIAVAIVARHRHPFRYLHHDRHGYSGTSRLCFAR